MSNRANYTGYVNNYAGNRIRFPHDRTCPKCGLAFSTPNPKQVACSIKCKPSRAKLSEKQREQARKWLAEGVTQKEVARRLHVTPMTVWRLFHKRRD